MLEFVVGCAVVVGTYYQWILPERRRKALDALTFWHLQPPGGPRLEPRELNRLRRRAGFPAVPESSTRVCQDHVLLSDPWPTSLTPWHQDGAMRFAAGVGAVCVAVLIAFGLS